MDDYHSPQTSTLFDLNHVFEQRWGDARFDTDDLVQFSDLEEEIKVQILLASKRTVVLGRTSPSSAGGRDTPFDGVDTAVIPISNKSRQQLEQQAATLLELEKRAETLHHTELPFINLQPFGADTLGVSRKHAVLERDGRYITLTDLHSTNGTFLNGTPLFPMQRRIVRNGDTVQLGSLELQVRYCRAPENANLDGLG